MQAGRWQVRAVETGRFRLDGGAMFGTVPKALWERTNPPDSANRIEMSLRALLAEDGERRVLVDAGIGASTFPAKEEGMYSIRNHRAGAADALQDLGVAPDSITDVILTHLHFDHAGGAVAGEALAFPEARHWLQRRNLENARKPNERERASYLPRTWQVLEDSGRLELVDGPVELLPGIRAVPSDGHTEGMQVLQIGEGPGAVLYCADLVPMTPHVRIPWVMGYDIHVALLIEEKRRLLEQAEKEGWLLFLEHDPGTAVCRVARNPSGRIVAGEAVEP